uniref:Putative ovule protein n=1 Tax=Solanum chacoense TaxID=4108 RepID=A0A0V0H3E2_SOLCH
MQVILYSRLKSGKKITMSIHQNSKRYSVEIPRNEMMSFHHRISNKVNLRYRTLHLASIHLCARQSISDQIVPRQNQPLIDYHIDALYTIQRITTTDYLFPHHCDLS